MVNYTLKEKLWRTEEILLREKDISAQRDLSAG